jgi:hypothetical protein
MSSFQFCVTYAEPFEVTDLETRKPYPAGPTQIGHDRKGNLILFTQGMPIPLPSKDMTYAKEIQRSFALASKEAQHNISKRFDD